jgi:hypothetical protein
MIVGIAKNTWGEHCYVKSCKSKAKFMAFGDDMKPKLSRLEFCSCSKHLGLLTNRVLKENDKKRSKK